MKTELVKADVRVKLSQVKGYGVFADRDFDKHEIIEETRMLVSNVDDPNFNNYQFVYDKERFMLPLGNACLYNHSDKFNAEYCADKDNHLFLIRAKEAIKKGEEIFLHYGDEWFSSRNARKLPPRSYRSPFFQILYKVMGIVSLIAVLAIAWSL